MRQLRVWTCVYLLRDCCVLFLFLFIFLAWLFHTCDMTDSHVWHDSFICVPWFIHICDMVFWSVTWLTGTYDKTQSYAWPCACMYVTWPFICVLRLFHMCGMTNSDLRHDSFISETWLIHILDVIYSCAWHDSFICVLSRMHHMCVMTHYYLRRGSFIRVTQMMQLCSCT